MVSRLMSALAAKFKGSTVPRLLAKFGEDATLLIPAEPDSAADPWTPAPTPTTTTARVAPGDIKEMRRKDSIVQSTDWTGIMSAEVAVEPKQDMSLIVGGVTYLIKYVEPIRVQGVNVAYEIAGRR